MGDFKYCPAAAGNGADRQAAGVFSAGDKRDRMRGVEATAKRLDEVKSAPPLPCPSKDARTPMRAASAHSSAPAAGKEREPRPPHPPYERRG